MFYIVRGVSHKSAVAVEVSVRAKKPLTRKSPCNPFLRAVINSRGQDIVCPLLALTIVQESLLRQAIAKGSDLHSVHCTGTLLMRQWTISVTGEG